MQKKQLWMLNAALAAFAVLLAMRLAGDWRRGNERYRMLDERSHAAGVLSVVPVSQAQPAAAEEVVARNLFTPDRNNNRAQVAQSRPPLPVAIGTMRLAGGYEALMSEGGAATASPFFRRVKKGDVIGGYTVAEIRDEAVAVEYQGERSEINVYQSAQSVARTVAGPVTSAPTTRPAVETTASTTVPVPAAAQEAVVGASSPAGSLPTGAAANLAGTVVAQPRRRRLRSKGTVSALSARPHLVPKSGTRT